MFNKVLTSDGHMATEINEIMSEQVKFYKKLYKKEITDPYAQNILLSNLTRKLDADSLNTCEATITLDECEKALSESGIGKSPGSDGIPYEFYKEFWNIFQFDFLEVIEHTFKSGLLSPTQRKGMITLLHKKGDKENLANWRPITLLNADYKLISKVLANRLKSVLPCIINEDQTCGIPGRTINSNLSLLRDIVTYSNSVNSSAALICLDQLKAFDRVDWNFIYRTLNAMNFGPNFINHVRTLYTDISSAIKCNGFVSEFFNLERGVRQGCPLSPLLYCIVAEVMAEAIRNEPKISGIKLPNNSYAKITQYADDTTLFVSDEDSIATCFSVMRVYEAASGAKMNNSKTKGLWLGSMRQNKTQPEGITWTNDKLNVLGIWIGNTDCTRDNWETVLKKFEATLNLWSQRDLSYQGKVTVINTLASSKLWYLSNVFPIPQWGLQKVNSAITKFLWNGKAPMVNKTVCQQTIERGGINLVDINSKLKSQRIVWTCNILKEANDAKSKILAKHFFGLYRNTKIGLDVLNLDLKLAFQNCESMPKFYRECLQAWKSLQPTRPNPTTKRDILNEPLFDNPKIKNVNNNGSTSTFFIKSLVDKGIVYIKNICNGHHFVTPDNVANYVEPVNNNRRNLRYKYDLLISCIPQEWINILKENNCLTEQTETVYTFRHACLSDPLCHEKVTARIVYRALVVSREAPHTQTKWENLLLISPKWNLVWRRAKHKSLDKYMSDLNWRIIHQALKTNYWAQKAGILQSASCVMCKDVNESVVHVIASCPHALNLWSKVNLVLSKYLDIPFTVNLKTIILGMYEKDTPDINIVNFVLSSARYAIWLVRNAITFDQQRKNTHVFKSLIISRINQQSTTNAGCNDEWQQLKMCL